MTPADIITAARTANVKLSLNGDRVHLSGPAQAVESLRSLVRAHKAELLKLLVNRPPCSGCANLRMTEIPVPGLTPPYRFVWGCARGHLDNGFTLPDLPALRAPDSCVTAGDRKQAFVAERKTATRN